jgi:hypothetical protein
MWETNFDPKVPAAEHVPPDLDEMAPGPVLAAFLSAIDTASLSGHDRVLMLRARQRMASHYAGQVYSDMVAVADALEDPHARHEDTARLAASEIRAALHLTRRAADIELSFAMDLQQRLPEVHRMLTTGLLDVRRAKTIENGTCHLSVGAARGVVERVAEAAPELTTGQLAARIRKLCIEADTDEANNRYGRALDDRRVVAQPTIAGTAHLSGTDLPPHRVAAATRRINGIARSLRRDDDSRTMDQLRADVYLDLLQGTDHTKRSGGVVHLTTDLGTLAGLADHPGDLNGFAPVIADIAREVADQQPDAEWRYTVTDAESGEPLHTGITRRRPTVTQRRRVESRSPTCVFPGCRMPAGDCDLDHRTSWAEGGPTTPDNLAPLCRPDHLLKHNGWSLRQCTRGRYQWTSPLGHTYIAGPEPP